MSAAVVISADTCQFNNIRLSAGWYMIEARPNNQAIGCFLNIRAFSDPACLHPSGSQTIQLVNARTAKRILKIDENSQSLCVGSSTAQDLTKIPNIVLVRLTTTFARKRLIKALPQTMQHSQRANGAQSDCQLLYQLYTDLCPVPDVNKSYRPGTQASTTPLTSVTDDPAVADTFSMVIVDADTDEKPDNKPTAPFVIIISRCVREYTELQAVLATVGNDAIANDKCLWYTDHDHVRTDGTRTHPQLKPSVNKGLLRHGNYVGPLVICTRVLYDKLGGVDTSLGDSCILLFLLKAFDHLAETSIHRIARIGYSLPFARFHPPHGLYVGENDKLAFDIYQRQKTDPCLSVVAGVYPSTWQLRPATVTVEPSVDILIATRDRLDLLSQCVGSILSNTQYGNFTVTVADNDSIEKQTHEYHTKMLQDCRYRKIDCPGEFNYAAINNTAANQSSADLLLLLNNDTEVHQPDWLQRMVSELLDPDVGCVGARLLYPNGLLQHAGIVTGLQGMAGHLHQYAPATDDGYSARIKLSTDVSAVTGACLGIRRALYKELGGLDAEKFKVAYNDVDLCLRARNAGYRNRYLADVTLTHHESVSRGSDDNPGKRARFLSEVAYMKELHGAWIKDDPAWHPDFSRQHTTPFLTGR